MYESDKLDYYKLVAKKNWIFSFLKGPLVIKFKRWDYWHVIRNRLDINNEKIKGNMI